MIDLMMLFGLFWPWAAVWLKAEAGSMARTNEASLSFNAVALVARLWSPNDAKQFLKVHGTVSSATHVAVTWAKALKPAFMRKVTFTLLNRICDLGERLDRSNNSSNADEVLHLLLERDELETILWLMRTADMNITLYQGVVAGLDQDMQRTLGAMTPVRLPANDRLDAVAWQYPECWWATFYLAHRQA